MSVSDEAVARAAEDYLAARRARVDAKARRIARAIDRVMDMPAGEARLSALSRLWDAASPDEQAIFADAMMMALSMMGVKR